MNRIAICVALTAAACAHDVRYGRSPGAETMTLAGRSASSAPEAPEAMLQRSAGLTVERSDPDAGPPAAVALAKGFGGWVQRSTNASVSLQVPEPKLDEFLGAAKSLGDVTDRQVRAVDVGEQYRDSKIRLENLERSRARVLELLQKANSVQDTLAVEKELERLTTAIEAMKGRLQYLEAHTAFASVDIRFQRPVSPGPVGWVFYGLYRGIKWLFVWD